MALTGKLLPFGGANQFSFTPAPGE